MDKEKKDISFKLKMEILDNIFKGNSMYYSTIPIPEETHKEPDESATLKEIYEDLIWIQQGNEPIEESKKKVKK